MMRLFSANHQVFHLHSLLAALCALVAAVFWGCTGFAPAPIHESLFRTRAENVTRMNVRVSAAVLGAEETEAVFGLPLYRKGIQPIWLEIENKTEHRMWFAPVSVDRGYFSPLEVAYMHHFGHSKTARLAMDRYFHQHAIGNTIDAGKVRSGFIFTNLELGTKAFNVELVGEGRQVRTFTFLIPVPGMQVDHREVDWTSLLANQERIGFESADAFRKAIEELPCCVTDADGTRQADPVNVVIIGPGVDVLFALLRSGWDETASAASYDRTAQLPWEFRYQPVKPLFLFGRSQDAAFRKSRSTLNERNQLRLWLSPFQYERNRIRRSAQPGRRRQR
jgi:hypothetical protein